MVVLMREADAIARGCRIYASVTGWGISSDGKGGITRPEAAGHQLAIERAYDRAGYGVETVSYFEGHGTGTAVGDATEIEALSGARRAADPTAAPAALGTIKGNIGHTKAAAGIAGLIKATLAVHHQVIPPATGHFDAAPQADRAGRGGATCRPTRACGRRTCRCARACPRWASAASTPTSRWRRRPGASGARRWAGGPRRWSPAARKPTCCSSTRPTPTALRERVTALADARGEAVPRRARRPRGHARDPARQRHGPRRGRRREPGRRRPQADPDRRRARGGRDHAAGAGRRRVPRRPRERAPHRVPVPRAGFRARHGRRDPPPLRLGRPRVPARGRPRRRRPRGHRGGAAEHRRGLDRRAAGAAHARHRRRHRGRAQPRRADRPVLGGRAGRRRGAAPGRRYAAR